MEGVAAKMTVQIPSEQQMAAIIDAKIEHAKFCQFQPAFDLSNISITVTCRCGWTMVLELDKQNEATTEVIYE